MSQPINLTDEQQEFRAVVRRFAEDKIAPRAAATDEKAEYDWEAFKALVAADLTSLQYPEEYGGQGAPLVTQAIAAEARRCRWPRTTSRRQGSRDGEARRSP